jgi:hypothetical protein
MLAVYINVEVALAIEEESLLIIALVWYILM